MKLTSRQRKIFLVSALLFILALTVLISAVLIVSRNKKKISPQISEKTDNSELVKTKTEIINSLEQKLSSDNIKKDDLLKGLKERHYLDAGETNWEKYLNTATTPKELEVRKKNILAIVEKLIGETPNPQPGAPSPSPQNPSPQSPHGPVPETPPTDKWEKILWEIRQFFDTNPTSLQEMKDWVKKQNYPDPLEGVDLKGASADQLKLIPNRGKVPDIEKADNKTRKYQDYVQLSAVGDGNCFLNSFSVFLTGNANDTSLSMPLKVKLCLDFMATEGFTDGSNIYSPEFIKDKLIGSGGFAKPGAWLESADIMYIAPILERPIAVVSKHPEDPRYGEFSGEIATFEFPEDLGFLSTATFPFTHKERWVIYNSGGHFQPLIKK
jgi:hypothetical protein